MNLGEVSGKGKKKLCLRRVPVRLPGWTCTIIDGDIDALLQSVSWMYVYMRPRGGAPPKKDGKGHVPTGRHGRLHLYGRSCLGSQGEGSSGKPAYVGPVKDDATVIRPYTG